MGRGRACPGIRAHAFCLVKGGGTGTATGTATGTGTGTETGKGGGTGSRRRRNGLLREKLDGMR